MDNDPDKQRANKKDHAKSESPEYDDHESKSNQLAQNQEAGVEAAFTSPGYNSDNLGAPAQGKAMGRDGRDSLPESIMTTSMNDQLLNGTHATNKRNVSESELDNMNALSEPCGSRLQNVLEKNHRSQANNVSASLNTSDILTKATGEVRVEAVESGVKLPAIDDRYNDTDILIND